MFILGIMGVLTFAFIRQRICKHMWKTRTHFQWWDTLLGTILPVGFQQTIQLYAICILCDLSLVEIFNIFPNFYLVQNCHFEMCKMIDTPCLNHFHKVSKDVIKVKTPVWYTLWYETVYDIFSQGKKVYIPYVKCQITLSQLYFCDLHTIPILWKSCEISLATLKKCNTVRNMSVSWNQKY